MGLRSVFDESTIDVATSRTEGDIGAGCTYRDGSHTPLGDKNFYAIINYHQKIATYMYIHTRGGWGTFEVPLSLVMSLVSCCVNSITWVKYSSMHRKKCGILLTQEILQF